mmetsp:Transcript_1430/g.1262  ORF Transcript_1430/g.1262 Transcript_1430/m.1262 type:complete len:155 (+) Transcript_1430:67-531(+)
MDFDATNKVLYTGDEMGNMHKWDLSRLIDKLTKFDERMEANKHSDYGIGEFKETLNQFEKMHNFDLDDTKSQEEKKVSGGNQEDKSKTFLTSAKMAGNVNEDIEDEDSKTEKDVFLVHRWKAHTDGITWVTFNENPTFIATSSFDKNVYIWNEH